MSRGVCVVPLDRPQGGRGGDSSGHGTGARRPPPHTLIGAEEVQAWCAALPLGAPPTPVRATTGANAGPGSGRRLAWGAVSAVLIGDEDGPRIRRGAPFLDAGLVFLATAEYMVTCVDPLRRGVPARRPAARVHGARGVQRRARARSVRGAFRPAAQRPAVDRHALLADRPVRQLRAGEPAADRCDAALFGLLSGCVVHRTGSIVHLTSAHGIASTFLFPVLPRVGLA